MKNKDLLLHNYCSISVWMMAHLMARPFLRDCFAQASLMHLADISFDSYADQASILMVADVTAMHPAEPQLQSRTWKSSVMQNLNILYTHHGAG